MIFLSSPHINHAPSRPGATQSLEKERNESGSILYLLKRPLYARPLYPTISGWRWENPKFLFQRQLGIGDNLIFSCNAGWFTFLLNQETLPQGTKSEARRARTSFELQVESSDFTNQTGFLETPEPSRSPSPVL